MNLQQPVPPIGPRAWLDRIESLAPAIRGHRAQGDSDSRLPSPLVEALASAGLFRMWLPVELGGYNVEPPIALRVIQAAARIDGSTGWCLGPGNVSSLFSAYLPESAARDVYGGDWSVNAAGSHAGMGWADAVATGFRLSGRWAFCTNSHGCPWFLGIFTVRDAGQPRRNADGSLDLRFFFFPADKARILPTWDTGGLRATASNDIVLEDAVVGENYGFRLGDPPWPAAPMYAAGLKLWPPTAFAAVALGIAETAIEALTEIATTRIPTMGSSPMRDNAVLRHELGRADAALSAASDWFYGAVEDCSAALRDSRSLSRRQTARLGQACSYLADVSRDVTQTMYRLGGGASVYKSCPLDRCLRDISVATQHASIGPRHYDEAARERLGMPHA